jgi:putative flippase GtrA
MTLKTTADGNATSPVQAKPNEIKHLMRFVVIGSSSVLIDLLVYQLLLDTLSTSLAKGISYLAGMCFGFIGNKYWTFESKAKAGSEILGYGLLYSITLAINIILNNLLLDWLGSERKLVCFLIVTGITTVLNFLGLRLITFRKGIDQRVREQSP